MSRDSRRTHRVRRRRRHPRRPRSSDRTNAGLRAAGRPAALLFLYALAVAPILQLKDLTKVYRGGTRALDGISLDVANGEFVVLIGLSGSGKSTLLRCINRLIDPTSGKVIFEGTDVTRPRGAELRRVRPRIGMIFQQV